MTVATSAPPTPTRPQVSLDQVPPHPLGTRARVLLSSVFGPYAQDDEHGGRALNPMELYHNQVTRVQGPFSLRMFHRSWGMMLIQANIEAPCTLLDFPTLDRFIEEISTRQYDIIGIGSIIPNAGKVEHMCRLIRQHQPQATIVIGGHVANMPRLAERLDADHIVRGEGVRWFQRFLGQRDDQPIRHPHILSGLGTRSMGIMLRDKPGDVAATLIPSVGCPLGCNFCATSAMFGGKGKFINFYDTGDELFKVMLDLEANLKVQSFFVMDENFLLHRPRALRLLELMQEHNKSWALYVFSSANVLKSYTIEQLVALGISWVWMGMEGQSSQYKKLAGADTRTLVKELQGHGIRVLGSSIIGLEEHTPENIGAAIDYAASHDTEFHQFMLYTPIPGTPLWASMDKQGVLKDSTCRSVADDHGQWQFNYRHPNLPAGSETEYLIRAFTRDFEVNGPSIARVARTTLLGWLRHRNHPDKRVRARYVYEARELGTTYAAALWAARKWYSDKPAIAARIDQTLQGIYKAFGWKSRIAAALGGRYVLRKLRQENARLQSGWTYEPPTFYEQSNQVAATAPSVSPAPWSTLQPSRT